MTDAARTPLQEATDHANRAVGAMGIAIFCLEDSSQPELAALGDFAREGYEAVSRVYNALERIEHPGFAREFQETLARGPVADGDRVPVHGTNFAAGEVCPVCKRGSDANKPSPIIAAGIECPWCHRSTPEQHVIDHEELRTARKALEGIIIRCREGDPRSDWLPAIDGLAEEALAALPAPGSLAKPATRASRG